MKRTDCSPEFVQMWDDAEKRPAYWLEMVLLQIEEQRLSIQRMINKHSKKYDLPKAFWKWSNGKVDGLTTAKKIIKRAIKDVCKAKSERNAKLPRKRMDK